MKFPPDLVALLSVFAKHDVNYLVIGGHAVGVHARPRSTKDLDLWLDHSRSNIARACRALQAFGLPAHLVEVLRTASANEIVWIGRAPARVDFLFSIPGATFRDAWTRRVEVIVDGIAIQVIGKEDLIANKRATGRPQDRRDVRALQRLAPDKRSVAGRKREPDCR